MDSGTDAIKGLTNWGPMGEFARAFPNGWQAVIAFGIIATAVVVIILTLSVVGLAIVRSNNRTRIRIAQLTGKPK